VSTALETLASSIALDEKWFYVRKDVVRLPSGKVVDDFFLWEGPPYRHDSAYYSGWYIHTRNLDQLYVLVGALKVLGLEGAAQSFIPRLTGLKKRVPSK
jgi:hypothetical protein